MQYPNEVISAAYSHRENQAAIKDNLSQEIKESSGFDGKHILNLSDRTPNITPEHIENDGVSVEELAGLNVPWCKYQTQITIHGSFDAWTQPCRQAVRCGATGYKSLIRNKNGSIGVRWVAIDGAKKKLLGEALRYSPKRIWSFHQSSTDTALTLCKAIGEIEELRQIAKTIPMKSFTGTAALFKASIYGLAFIDVQVSAIPLETLWDCIRFFTGISSQAELDAAIAKRKAEQEQEEAKRKAERAVEIEKRIAEREVLIEKIEQKYGVKQEKNPVVGKHYVRIGRGCDGKPYYANATFVKSFGRVIMKSERHETLELAKQAAIEGRKITLKGSEYHGQIVFAIQKGG